MTGARIAVPLGLAVALAVAALAVLPRAYEAERLLSSQDDPVALADRAVARSLNSSVAVREINAALAGLTYQGNLNFNGSDALTVATSDGTATDTNAVAITVNVG